MFDFSEDGYSVLKPLEGWRAVAYLCAADKPTIGYGHVILPGDKHKITKLEGALLLKKDVLRFSQHVWRCCEEGGRIPNQHQFDAMVCLAFNIGEKGFLRSSVLRLFLNHDDAAAAGAFHLWHKIRKVNAKTGKRELRPSRTLEARRATESRMFLLGYYDKTPYNTLDDGGVLAELKLSRNHSKDDDIIESGDTEIRPTIKSSRTIKEANAGSISAAVTAASATAAAVKTVADQVALSSNSVKKAVDATVDVVEVATESSSMFQYLLPFIFGGIAMLACYQLLKFIRVRFFRKDDWRRGKC